MEHLAYDVLTQAALRVMLLILKSRVNLSRSDLMFCPRIFLSLLDTVSALALQQGFGWEGCGKDLQKGPFLLSLSPPPHRVSTLDPFLLIVGMHTKN